MLGTKSQFALNPLRPSVILKGRFEKISILKKGIIEKKTSYESRVYELVDDSSLS